MSRFSDEIKVRSAACMLKLGAKFADYIKPGFSMYLEGDLGAGKTTLVQGIFKKLQISGPVLSPTFSILETYTTKTGLNLLHLDLYRIENPEELYMIGLEEYSHEEYAWFVEWPQRGIEFLPAADVRIEILHNTNSRTVNVNSNFLVASL